MEFFFQNIYFKGLWAGWMVLIIFTKTPSINLLFKKCLINLTCRFWLSALSAVFFFANDHCSEAASCRLAGYPWLLFLDCGPFRFIWLFALDLTFGNGPLSVCFWRWAFEEGGGGASCGGPLAKGLWLWVAPWMDTLGCRHFVLGSLNIVSWLLSSHSGPLAVGPWQWTFGSRPLAVGPWQLVPKRAPL